MVNTFFRRLGGSNLAASGLMTGLGSVSRGWKECQHGRDSYGDDAVRDAEIFNEGEYLEDK